MSTAVQATAATFRAAAAMAASIQAKALKLKTSGKVMLASLQRAHLA
jgi:hypothetical protein